MAQISVTLSATNDKCRLHFNALATELGLPKPTPASALTSNKVKLSFDESKLPSLTAAIATYNGSDKARNTGNTITLEQQVPAL